MIECRDLNIINVKSCIQLINNIWQCTPYALLIVFLHNYKYFILVKAQTEAF